MKFVDKNYKKALNRESEILKFFAWFPITISGETRWLEKVNVEVLWRINNDPFFGRYPSKKYFKFI